MKDNIIENLLKENLNSLVVANKNSKRSGEELKAITEAIGITVNLLTCFDLAHCDSNGYHLKQGESITNPLTKD